MVDTAGISPARNPGSKMEELVSEDVDKTLRYSNVTIVVIDSKEAFMKQDFMIINKILDEGRGVVVVANKWDAVSPKFRPKAVRWMEKQLERGLGQARGIPIAYISAKTG